MTRRPRLIFLMGYKGSGKDTFAELLVNQYKKDGLQKIVKVALADAIKKEIYPKHGVEFTGSLEEDREFKESVRSELISYGEGMKQEHGMWYWVEKAIHPNIIGKTFDELPDILITDCRRVEEVMWFKHFKFGLIEPELAKIYIPSFYIVHREGVEELDKDYLTAVATRYAVESKILDKLIRNYTTVEHLESIAKEVYAVKLR